MSLGNNIAGILKIKELSQKEFAEKLNISQATLSGYVRNKREPDYDTLKRIATELGVSIDYLLDTPESIARNYSVLESDLLKRFRTLNEQQKTVAYELIRLMSRQNI